MQPGDAQNRQAGGRQNGGGYDRDTAPFDGFMPQINESELDDFLDSGYRDWLDSLRNAEGFLADNERYRDEVSRIREELEELRKRYRDENSLPKYDLFLEKIAMPLAMTASELQREINERLKDQEVFIADEGSVPHQYEEFVAEYFKHLSEVETVQ